MEFNGITVLVAFGLMYGGGMLWRYLRRRKQRRAIRVAAKVGRVTIGAAPEGERVRVVGTVADTEAALTSPLTQRRCVAFYTSIEAHTGDVMEPWEIVAEERGGVDFELTDDTGRALVVVGDAALEYDASVLAGTVTKQMAAGHLMLARHRTDPRSRPFAKHFRFRERTFPIGAPIAVIGTSTVQPDDGAAAPRLRFAAAPVVTDAPIALR